MAKWKHGRYLPDNRASWLEIQNPQFILTGPSHITALTSS